MRRVFLGTRTRSAEIIPPAFRTLGMAPPPTGPWTYFIGPSFFIKGLDAVWPNLLVLLAFTAVFMTPALCFFKIEE